MGIFWRTTLGGAEKTLQGQGVLRRSTGKGESGVLFRTGLWLKKRYPGIFIARSQRESFRSVTQRLHSHRIFRGNCHLNLLNGVQGIMPCRGLGQRPSLP
jgi:hypothetical protein